MKPCSFYSFRDLHSQAMNQCSMASESLPLTVNCAGCFESVFPFTTDNTEGRLDYYLMYLLSGRLTVPLPHGTVVASPGTLILFPPHFPYRYTYEAKGERLTYLWIHFTGSHAGALLQDLFSDTLPASYAASNQPSVTVLFTQLFEQFHRSDPLRDHVLGCTLEQILLSFAEAIRKEGSALPSLGRSLRYIHASYTDPIRIPELARMENLSSSRYHALFHKKTGTSPGQYIARLRMEHACELLRSTDLPIHRIGDMVGYADSHFFSKLFKAHTGVSPSEYRRQ